MGQLFLVTFQGTDASDASQIYDLIVNYHVGGVVLLADNDNFAAVPDTLTGAHRLIASLQEAEHLGSAVQILDTDSGRLVTPAYIPLWVGIAQEGNGAPTDQILNGLTPLPSEMAVGATWQPSLAEQVGSVAGQELAALGFNLYIGPSLDVLDQPSSISSGDLGTRAFGGDPFWVGEMGRAYIRGLHSGSDNHLLVISKHFPGRGSSDRLPEQEVATVRKSLEQLKQIELAPFFAVTGNAPDAQSTTDGLLVSHIRYQGFQGNIRATTRPVSFDAQALGEILKLPQFSVWRDNGGLIVSDDLGSRAVRDFYAPADEQFNARLIVRDAFLAGNDLLYLGNIYSTNTSDHDATVRQVLSYFAQRYVEDPAFAQRVDAAVARILTRKLGLYGTFSADFVTPDTERLDAIGTSNQIVFQVASQAASLISPERQELDSILPGPPTSTDYLVFLTDSSSAYQCSTCPEQSILAPEALQQAILRLYGTTGGGQAVPSHFVSYSFGELSDLLEGNPIEGMEPALRRATWVVISVTDVSSTQSQLVPQFLAQRQDLLRAKKIILFSFGAPYYFDSTDIAKLSAYFALYSKSPAFVDTAARDSVSGTAIHWTFPRLDSQCWIRTDQCRPRPIRDRSSRSFWTCRRLPRPRPSPSLTPEPTAMPSFNLGDMVTVRTGIILDNNGNPVPDETVVRFAVSLGGEGGGVFQQQDAFTKAGVAGISFRIDRPGLVEIRAASEPATISEVLQLDVTEGEAAVVTVIVPVLSETVVPVPIHADSCSRKRLCHTRRRAAFRRLDVEPVHPGWWIVAGVLGGRELG